MHCAGAAGADPRAGRADGPGYTLMNIEGLAARTTEGLKRIEQIVQDLRDFARLDEADIKEVDLNTASRPRRRSRGAGRPAEQRVEIETDLGPLPTVTCYPAKLNQVVLNMLINAIDASPRQHGRPSARERSRATASTLEVIDRAGGIDPAIRRQDLRPILHDQADRQGDGPGTLHRLRDRAVARRAHRVRLKAPALEPDSPSTSRSRRPRTILATAWMPRRAECHEKLLRGNRRIGPEPRPPGGWIAASDPPLPAGAARTTRWQCLPVNATRVELRRPGRCGGGIADACDAPPRGMRTLTISPFRRLGRSRAWRRSLCRHFWEVDGGSVLAYDLADLLTLAGPQAGARHGRAVVSNATGRADAMHRAADPGRSPACGLRNWRGASRRPSRARSRPPRGAGPGLCCVPSTATTSSLSRGVVVLGMLRQRFRDVGRHRRTPGVRLPFTAADPARRHGNW